MFPHSRTSHTSTISAAHHVLEQALLPGSNAIPQNLFKACVGVVLISVVEVGFVFSGSIGTGILLKREGENKWSKPTACGLGGVGWGFLVGGSVKDLVVFILDEKTLNSIAYDKAGIKVGGQFEAAIGPLGRSANIDLTISEKGIGNTISFSYSKGAFLGVSIEGAIVGARHAVNKKFYGKDVTPKEIFDGSVELPLEKATLLSDIYAKLEKLSMGVSNVPTHNEDLGLEKIPAAAAASSEQVAPDDGLKVLEDDIEFVNAADAN